MELDVSPQQYLLRELNEETSCDYQIQTPLEFITKTEAHLTIEKIPISSLCLIC